MINVIKFFSEEELYVFNQFVNEICKMEYILVVIIVKI